MQKQVLPYSRGSYGRLICNRKDSRHSRVLLRTGRTEMGEENKKQQQKMAAQAYKNAGKNDIKFIKV